jgi:hypothetical protein
MSRLNLLGAWNGRLEMFFAGNSAQSFMRAGPVAMAADGSCGSSCGAGNGGGKKKEEPKPKPEGPACGGFHGGSVENPHLFVQPPKTSVYNAFSLFLK